jgi:hypothetical protein
MCNIAVAESEDMMNWYARFKDGLYDDGEIVYKVDDGTNNTRYAVIDEGKDEYAIALIPNDIETNKVCMFNKKFENDLFVLSEEV